MKQIPRKWQIVIIFSIFWALLGLSFAYISHSVINTDKQVIAPVLIFSLNLIKFFLWFAFAPLIFLLVKKFGFARRETFFRNFLIQIVIGFSFIILHTLVYTPISTYLDPAVEKNLPTMATLFERYLFFGNFYLGVLLYTLIFIICQGYLFFDSYLTERIRRSKLQTELAEARLQTLKMQLQPHFLFNTLHSISALNLSDPMKANQMIARLGDFLRMTLDAADEQMVTLHEELAFLRCYLEIEQIRFSDRLTVEYDIADTALSTEVPHLILQPIVENAVKHGIAPYAGKGEIKISAQKSDGKLLLQIKDDGAKKEGLITLKSNGVNGKGLKNVRLRLDHLYQENYRLDFQKSAGGMQVNLEIPLLKSNLEN
jgi:two-component system LytT family sensor kinase